MLAVDVPGLLTNLTTNLTSLETVDALRFSDEFLWNWLIAVCFTVHLMGMSVWLATYSLKERVQNPLRITNVL